MSDLTLPSTPGTYVAKAKDWDDGGWTSVPNALLRDSTISWEAKGAFAWLAVQRHLHRLTADDLAAAGPGGVARAHAMLRELQQAGWLTGHLVRNEEDTHRRTVYVLHSQPVPARARTIAPQEKSPSDGPEPGDASELELPLAVEPAEKPVDPSVRAAMRARGVDRFDEFWAIYPRREAKKGAQRKWEKAIKDGVTADEIIVGARRYADACKRNRTLKHFIKHPTTWLHGGCWEDEDPQPPIPDGHVPYQDPWTQTTPNDYSQAWERLAQTTPSWAQGNEELYDETDVETA